jgi:hypothetical protein
MLWTNPLQYYAPTHILVFLVVSFLLAFPPKSYMHSSSPPFMLYIMPISCSLTWSFSLYLMKRTSYEAPHYAVLLQPPVTSSLFGPSILLSTLFSNTLSLCSSLNVRNQVLHPYRTIGKGKNYFVVHKHSVNLYVLHTFINVHFKMSSQLGEVQHLLKWLVLFCGPLLLLLSVPLACSLTGEYIIYWRQRDSLSGIRRLQESLWFG